ncbi:anaerobic C4-dicarboxylate transporter DcuC [Shewanella sp. NFH-SH190041]|uniref:C4-dicarboxylate transporter DcuC n=1 Tax=Shewanella sp. NFH-SH190041 TaxID=2950245 RepID=UPI0021C3F6B1|nr:C4-dicarboxylate transporter DcuC [Shewanella sp. NFH-SH190041]BDM63315.1 anaerobic C4-dicarboxylate transporter DcuC [Shewanella sp. NFH-SH190041]
MNITLYLALAILFITIYLLLKKYETRTVLIGAGLALAIIAMHPLAALDAFATRMTSSCLIQAICASMGFAYVMKITRCNEHLVFFLSKVLSKFGIFIIPAAAASTMLINTAIPSAAGCAAAAGATLIPLMLNSKVKPAMAGAAILAGTIGSVLSPGWAHNAFVANMAHMEIVDLIAFHTPYSLTIMGITLVLLTLTAVVFRDYGFEKHTNDDQSTASANNKTGDNEATKIKPNIIYSIIPFVPLVILLTGNSIFPEIKTGIAQAMIIGSLAALILTRTNPFNLTKTFFSGMGSAYGDVIGIIIAASVFAEGLKVSGLVDSFIHILESSRQIAQWGASIGPSIMAILTGSGDAAAFAFNEAVTPHAQQMGFTIPSLGMLAAIAGSLGRTMSPVAGVTIVCAGMAGVSPMEIIKRTAPAMVVAIILLAVLLG